MTLSTRNRGLQTLSGILVFTLAVTASIAFCTSYASAQDKISPVSDYQYKKDYAQYEGIKKEADLQKRADMLLAFMKEHPISRMLTYVSADYLECAKPHIQNKNWAKVISMEEALLVLMPTEKTVQAAAVPEPGASDFLKNVLPAAHRSVQQALLAAYFQSNNLPKAAEIGEAMYAAAPDKTMAATMAEIYMRMQNQDKYLHYGEKIVADFPIEQSYGTALQMAQVYLQKQDSKKALELLGKVMDVYGEKVPPGLQESAWNATRVFAYNTMGADAYSKKDYPKAIELYGKAAKSGPKADDTAYYYTGMSKWRAQDPEGAIEAFAKAVVLGKANAKKAQEYLEQLWKARHNNTLDGLDQVLAKAKSELGIS
jgi:tetratricopeptide (TPR) repeat protein